MKKLMIMLTLFIGVNAFAQNQGNGKSKIEKSNQSDKVKGFEKENVFKEEAMEIKEQKKKVDVNVVKENNGKADAVRDKEVLKGWEKDKSEKVKDDHDDEMHDEDKEHADLDKETRIKNLSKRK